jgi:hypothetical protein
MRRKKTVRKRGGRIDSTRTYKRSRSRSLSPGRVRIIRRQDQGPQADQPAQQQARQVQQDEPVAIERWSFKVKCNNGEEYTSMHEHTRRNAMLAAREYCASRGGINGRVEYASRTSMI